jgi:hypothetical protein
MDRNSLWGKNNSFFLFLLFYLWEFCNFLFNYSCSTIFYMNEGIFFFFCSFNNFEFNFNIDFILFFHH